MKSNRTLLILNCLLSLLIIMFASFSCQAPFVKYENEPMTPEKRVVRITFLTDEAIKPFIGKTVGELLESVSLKQEKHVYFQEPPGLWAGCHYYFSNEQGLAVFVDDFQYHDQRDKKTVPTDEAFSKEIITGYRIFEWER